MYYLGLFSIYRKRVLNEVVDEGTGIKTGCFKAPFYQIISSKKSKIRE